MRAKACLCFLACLLAHTQAFHLQAMHLLPKPKRSVSASWCPAKPCTLYGEPWPKPASSAYTLGADKPPPRITADMKKLQEMVRALCCVLMFSDDIALMEREASKIEHIYFDLSSNVSRRPALLRSNLAALAQEYNIDLHAPPRKWHSVLRDTFDSV